MSADHRNHSRSLDERPVTTAPADASRIERCHTISASGYGAQAVWIFENAGERYLAINGGTDFRETREKRTARGVERDDHAMAG